MLERQQLREERQRINQQALDTANKIFESFPETNNHNIHFPFRTKRLSDGSEIDMSSFSHTKPFTLLKFSITPPEGNPKNPLRFSLSENGLLDLTLTTDFTTATSKIRNVPVMIHDSDSPDLTLTDEENHKRYGQFRSFSKELADWVEKVIQEDKLLELPFSINIK